MYAILDIETTGGQYNEEGITEIAIYKYDGHEITDQFISLINPEKPIQPFVVKLTGINNAMLRTAPKFYDVAKRIVEITEGCIIVAHNAQFDYRILRTEFERLGYDYERQSLCTVELSQKLMPEQKSHSLGKLVRALGIPMSDRHRATGDAMATVQLFKMLLAKDVEKAIIKSLIKSNVQKDISPKLFDLLEGIPSVTGLYYIYKENGDLIYIGKSNNIKKRLNQHFTGSSRKSKRLQRDIFTINYEETGSELIALLKECQEIKVNKPIHNRALKKTVFPYSLYSEKNKEGYMCLNIKKTDGRRKEIISFAGTAEAKKALFKITDKYKLCQKLNGLETAKTACFPYKLGNCNGACIEKEPSAEYNKRVTEFINHNSFNHQSMIIIDKGRSIEEHSAVLIEKGVYKGYAFFNLNYQITNSAILKNILVPMEHNRDVKNIIQGYISRKRNLKIIRF
ncbi:GIY-YIG nuclease family protein [Flavobacterium salilacus subsp. salilacus]|uniref:exonuclease domain-containing protein n=1 Tax=Flavobacterium TaxID=237 RepID=UPI001075161A|nr:MULTISPECIES: exonuclease domain-containing protein [Flavobacterium]KAF2517498.1 GIY-YIG nuclease family protein [Flavobacterium salilacus subsp. salilacus]MBE1615645.1 GIY-YIG nuclease family protein [Flavobacterium sp. SaA2.13]